jgi:hypothetical protein
MTISLLSELQQLSSGLTRETAATLLGEARDCIRVRAATTESLKSRFGGAIPAVLFQHQSSLELTGLRMMADIFLSEVPPTGLLPDRGRLLILADNGEDIRVRTFCALLPEDTPTVRAGSVQEQCLSEVPVRFEASLSLPEFYPPSDNMWDIFNIIERFGVNRSRLLGHIAPEVTSTIDSNEADWVLLAQFDSFDPLEELEWWDNGRLQVIIPRKEIECGLFRESKGVIVGVG